MLNSALKIAYSFMTRHIVTRLFVWKCNFICDEILKTSRQQLRHKTWLNKTVHHTGKPHLGIKFFKSA